MSEHFATEGIRVRPLRVLGMISLFGGSAVTGVVSIAYLHSSEALWAGVGLSMLGFIGTAVVAGRIKDKGSEK